MGNSPWRCSFGLMTTSQAPAFRPALDAREVSIARLRPLMRIVLASEPCERSPMFKEFERAVRTSAATLRDQGMKPEQMVIVLKQATSRGVLRVTATREDDLHYRMILWSVCEYFRCES